ncbi:MAG: hypothetical protein RRX93_07825 [Bacteroidales bacterium]
MNFNSKEYTYCDMQVVLFGKPIMGLKGIEYTSKKNKEVLYGAGRYPHAVQHGKREYDGTLTLLQSELIALDRSAQLAGYKDCLDLDFDIVVCYLSPTGILTTDVIKGASITEKPKSLKMDDLQMEVALPFVALNILDNIV